MHKFCVADELENKLIHKVLYITSEYMCNSLKYKYFRFEHHIFRNLTFNIRKYSSIQPSNCGMRCNNIAQMAAPCPSSHTDVLRSNSHNSNFRKIYVFCMLPYTFSLLLLYLYLNFLKSCCSRGKQETYYIHLWQHLTDCA